MIQHERLQDVGGDVYTKVSCRVDIRTQLPNWIIQYVFRRNTQYRQKCVIRCEKFNELLEKGREGSVSLTFHCMNSALVVLYRLDLTAKSQWPAETILILSQQRPLDQLMTITQAIASGAGQPNVPWEFLRACWHLSLSAEDQCAYQAYYAHCGQRRKETFRWFGNWWIPLRAKLFVLAGKRLTKIAAMQPYAMWFPCNIIPRHSFVISFVIPLLFLHSFVIPVRRDFSANI